MNFQINKITLYLILILVVFSIPLVYAQTNKEIIPAKEDSTVAQDNPNSNSLRTTQPNYPWNHYGEWIFLGSGTTNIGKFDSNEIVKNNAYIKFNVKDIPKTDPFQVVDIDAKLHLLIQEIDGSKRTLITVKSCTDNSWNQNEIVWSERPCSIPDVDGVEGNEDSKEMRGEDSIIVEKEDLPGTFSWDVSRIVSYARNNDVNHVTLVVSAIPLKHAADVDNPNFESELGTTLVWIWSSELKHYGVNSAPTLFVNYDVSNSSLSRAIEFSLVVILPTMVIVVPVIIWLIKRKK